MRNPPRESSAAKWAVAAVGGVIAVVLSGLKYSPKATAALLGALLHFGHGLDGTYVWQGITSDSAWGRITIDGERATVSFSTGDSERARVERTGDTIRLVDELTLSGSSDSGPSKVTLGRLTQGGQAIDMDVSGYTMRFVKQ